MNVLFVTTALRRGGAEQQWRTLLPALHRGGRTVSLLTLQDRGAFFDEIAASGIPAFCADLRGRWDLPRMLAAVRWAPAAEVVVAQGVDALVVASFISRRRHAALVAVEHGGQALGRRRHRRLLTRLAAGRVDRLVAVSPSQSESLQGFGYRLADLVVIPNGVESATPRRSRAAVREELGIAPDTFLITFVGGLRAPKRPDAFARAFTAPALAGAHGAVVGDGPLREAVEEAARATHGRVGVLGERDDVADVLGASDAFCLVSGTEGLPMSVLEAMSASLPVVASDVGGVSDAVVHDDTGLLVPPGDEAALVGALARLVGDPELARRLGAAGRARYERRFSDERMVAAFATLLDETVGAR